MGMRMCAGIGLALLLCSRAAVTSACTGDCNNDASVTVDELLTMVNIALGTTAITSCEAGDANHDSQITIDEILAAVNNALSGCGGQGPFAQGLAELAAGDLHSSTQRFCQAASIAPSDDRASLYCTAARFALAVVEDPSVASLASRSGLVLTVDSHDVCGWAARLPDALPSGAPRTGEILSAARAVLEPAIDAAVSDLSRLPAAVQVSFDSGTLPSCVRGQSQPRLVDIDNGDVLASIAMLQAIRAGLDVLAAYPPDLDLQAFSHHTQQDVLAGAPALLTLTDAAVLGTAGQSLDAALNALAMATTSILAETDDQSDDLLVIVPSDRPGAQRLIQILNLVRQSLQGEVVLPTEVGLSVPARLNLSLFFSGRFGSLRPFLPPFDNRGDLDVSHFPDPTFGGTAADLTQSGVDDIVREIQRFVRRPPHVDSRGCSMFQYASDEAECQSLAAPNYCEGSYFYPGGYCSLYGCTCGF